MANGPKTPTQIFAEYTQNTAEDISNYVDNLKKKRICWDCYNGTKRTTYSSRCIKIISR